MTERTATCSCGGLKVRASGEPTKISACHCVACRHRTGAAFSIAVFYPEASVRVSGLAKIYSRKGDSGQPVEFHYCPDCGSSVFWRPAFRPGLVGVAHGCFGEDAPGAPTQAVYLEHQHPWLHIDLDKPLS